jgi:uncharacterized membrane protein HdeD (DUF308 family)
VAKDWLTVTWQMLVIRGVVAVLFGIMAIAWPISTALTLVLVWGIWALLDGISSIAQALRPGPGIAKIALGLMGVIGLVAAFFAIARPGVTAVTLTWILGIWLMARGVMELILAFSKEAPAPRWLLVLSAGLDFLLGILFAANPGRSAVSLTVVLGITALAWGAVFIVVGLMVRKDTLTLDSAPAV